MSEATGISSRGNDDDSGGDGTGSSVEDLPLVAASTVRLMARVSLMALAVSLILTLAIVSLRTGRACLGIVPALDPWETMSGGR